MRVSFGRLIVSSVRERPYKTRCLNSNLSNRILINHLPSRQLRYYSDDVKDSEKNSKSSEDSQIDPSAADTEPANSVDSDASPDPSSVSPPVPENPQPKHWRYRLPPPKPKDPVLAKAALNRSIAQTSLRKKLHWRPPLADINPAYDEALKYLDEEQKRRERNIERLETLIERAKQKGFDMEYINELERGRYVQLIFRDINNPEVRWRFKNGDIDLRLPAHQHLYKKNWTEGVYVLTIMQRLNTMKIIPDSLHSLNPKVEFRLRFHEKKTPSRLRVRKDGWRDTSPGELLPSKALMKPPRMEIIPHYRDWWESRKYTVVMMDLDVPDVENDSFTTKLHWMVKDIVASPIKTIIEKGSGQTVVPYLPPHPFRGMKYHRYPLFVFEQPSGEWLESRTLAYQQHKEQVLQQQSPPPSATQSTDIKVSPLVSIPNTSSTTLRTYATESSPRKSKYAWDNLDRDKFNIRAWANQMGMKPVGAHLVRCEWDANVPIILESLGIQERAFKKIKSQETHPLDFGRTEAS